MGAWHHCAQQLSGNRRTAYWRRGPHPYPAVLEYRLCNRQDNVGGAKLELSNSKSSGGTRRNHYGHRDPGHVHRGYCHVSIFHDRRIAADWTGIFLRFLYALPLVVHFERELFYLADPHGGRTTRLLHCAFRNQGPGRRVEHGADWCLPSGSSNDTSSHGWRCADHISFSDMHTAYSIGYFIRHLLRHAHTGFFGHRHPIYDGGFRWWRGTHGIGTFRGGEVCRRQRDALPGFGNWQAHSCSTADGTKQQPANHPSAKNGGGSRSRTRKLGHPDHTACASTIIRRRVERQTGRSANWASTQRR